MKTQDFLDANGLSQTEVGAALGVTGATVSRKLSGARNWRGAEIQSALAFFSERLGRRVTFEEAFGSTDTLSDLAEEIGRLAPGDYVIVALEDGTEVRGKVRDVAGDEVWVFIAGSRAAELHEPGGSYTARRDQVRREEAA